MNRPLAAVSVLLGILGCGCGVQGHREAGTEASRQHGLVLILEELGKPWDKGGSRHVEHVRLYYLEDGVTPWVDAPPPRVRKRGPDASIGEES